MKKLVFLGAAISVFTLPPSIAGALEGGGGSAPDPAAGWNTLWYHLMLDIWVIGIIFGAITVVFLIKYTRKSTDQEGAGPSLSIGQSLAWAIIPAFIFLADDFFLAAQGWKLWIDQRTVPENALEVKLTAQMYGWNFEFENGAVASGDDLQVPKGQPVVFRMTSDDTIHSFFLPHFRIKEDVMPGRTTFVWINPVKEGEHVLTCTEYCGVGHSDMFGKIKIVSPSKFEEWSKENQG